MDTTWRRDQQTGMYWALPAAPASFPTDTAAIPYIRERYGDAAPWVTLTSEAVAARAARIEALARVACEEFLPRGLGWLINHPRLLRFYVQRLPHRRRPVLVGEWGRERYELR